MTKDNITSLDSGLVEHFTRMMEAAANYVEPTVYVARHPNVSSLGDCKWVREFPEPNERQSEAARAATKSRRDQAFINDMIYMLDGPEQRAAIRALKDQSNDRT